MTYLKEITITNALIPIRQADAEKAFLPSAEEPDFSVEKFLKAGESLGFRLFGFYDDTHQLLGFVSLIPRDETSISIGPMYISPEFRGKGYGKTQIEQVIAWAKENNFKGLFTKTWGKNAASRRIFEEFGFDLVKEKLNDRVNGDSTVKYFLDF